MGLEERVKNIVVTELSVDPDKVKNDSSFVDDLGADSLDTVELIMKFEQEFDLEEISEDDARHIKTVSDAIEYLKNKVGE